MKPLKRLCATCMLTLALALCAFAGDMGAGVTSPPPPSDSQATTTGNMPTGVTGDMSIGVTGEMSAGITSTDTRTDFLLNLLQSLLALF